LALVAAGPDPTGTGQRVLGYQLAVAPSGRLFATYADGGNLIQLFNYPSGDCVREIRKKLPRDGQIHFTPTGYILASSGRGEIDNGPPGVVRRLSLWETATGDALGDLADGLGPILSDVAFSPDGRLAATAETQRARVWSLISGKQLASFESGPAPVRCLAFSPDRKLLATGGDDGTILLWDVSKLDRSPGPKPDPKDVEAAWSTLTGKGSPTLLKSIYTLAAAGDDAVALIRDKVRPIPEPDAKILAKLLKNLDDDAYDVRKTAETKLQALGDAARPALEQALARGGSAEFKKQLKHLLENPPPIATSGDQIRALRAVWVLEEVGTTAAKNCLKMLANGAAADPLTIAAREAVARLRNRDGRP
jgi:hypothetical protein